MILLIPVILLALTVAAMLALNWFRPQFAHHRLLAMGGAFAAWVSVWFVRTVLPRSLVVVNWLPGELFSASPALVLDQWSWPFAVAIVSLALAVMLTDVDRREQSGFWTWVGTLGLAVLGLFAVMAGNLLTLLLAWTLIDLLEIALLVPLVLGSPRLNSVIIYLSTSLFGTLMALGADVAARAGGILLTFESIPPQAGLLLLIAVAMRLGVFPLHVPFLREPALQRGLGTMLRLIPAVGSLALLPRIALAGAAFAAQSVLLLLGALAVVYGATVWLRSSNEIIGRPYWNLSLASFAIVAVVLGDAPAALSWGLSMIFVGAFAFLASSRRGGFRYFVVLVAFTFSMLPFTPTWPGGRLFAAQFNPLFSLLLIAHALLLLGLVRHLFRPAGEFGESNGKERWIPTVYFSGLILLVLSFYLVGIMPPFIFPSSLSVQSVLPLAVLLIVAVVFGVLQRREIRVPETLIVSLDSVFSLRWLYDFLGRVYYLSRRIARFVSGLFEGEGGILWALLFVALVISVIAGLGSGT